MNRISLRLKCKMGGFPFSKKLIRTILSGSYDHQTDQSDPLILNVVLIKLISTVEMFQRHCDDCRGTNPLPSCP